MNAKEIRYQCGVLQCRHNASGRCTDVLATTLSDRRKTGVTKCCEIYAGYMLCKNEQKPDDAERDGA
jgi:hypothetical protein